MDKAALKQSVYSIFSNKVMLGLALIAVPIALVEIFALAPAYTSLLATIDWLIWLVFLVEFVLKLYVEDKYTTYIANNRLDAAVSIIIIVSGIFVLTTISIPLPALGFLRFLRVFRALAYGDKAFISK